VAFAQSPDPAPSGPQTSPTPATCTANCPQTPAKPAAVSQDAPVKPAAGNPGMANPGAQGKPGTKPHKVITNEDFDARPHEFEVNGARELLDQINTCNRDCFDEVYRRVGITANSNVHWKQSLLNAIDKVKEDLPWQSLLREGISIQVQSCELQVQKKQDLLRFSDPRTVTHSELLVERQYEPKFREMTRRLADMERRANGRIANNVAEPYQAQFMQMQVDRIAHANCQITVSQPQDNNEDYP
jgi:hypothetical protein